MRRWKMEKERRNKVRWKKDKGVPDRKGKKKGEGIHEPNWRPKWSVLESHHTWERRRRRRRALSREGKRRNV